MKKILDLFLALSCFSVPTFADDENITVKLYGEEIHDKGVIINGRTLLPVREIFEKLGYTVDYNAEEKSALISKGDFIKVKYFNNEYKMTNGDTEIPLDVPAQIVNDKFMFPVRSIDHIILINIDWDAETKTVELTRNNAVQIVATGPAEE